MSTSNIGSTTSDHMLKQKQLGYGVYVINQDGDEKFNGAKLFNIGFSEALKDYNYHCFVCSQ